MTFQLWLTDSSAT